jgi:uncharacterized protein DUF736
MHIVTTIGSRWRGKNVSTRRNGNDQKITSLLVFYVPSRIAIAVGKVESGAGWARTSRGDRNFVSLRLHGPTFPAPIDANLIERDGQHELI